MVSVIRIGTGSERLFAVLYSCIRARKELQFGKWLFTFHHGLPQLGSNSEVGWRWLILQRVPPLAALLRRYFVPLCD